MNNIFLRTLNFKISPFLESLFFKVTILLVEIICGLNLIMKSLDQKRCFLIISALLSTCHSFSQVSSGGDYSQGISAMQTVTVEITKYVPIVVQLCYAIAGVVGVVGAISVYIAMNNDEQDVKKKIMMVVGACIFLIAAAQALPLFFGIAV